jgi:hypothetical protein
MMDRLINVKQILQSYLHIPVNDDQFQTLSFHCEFLLNDSHFSCDRN